MSHAAEFRGLHESGCFLLPNPWDVGSARFLEHLGYHALATTSAGHAFSLGLPDSVTALPVGAVLAHAREIVEATSLPVNVDFQNGYADDPKGVSTNVAACVRTGAAGLSIEDATGNPESPLYERTLAIERIAAARLSIDDSGVPVVLTARCEAWLTGARDARSIVMDRLVAFAEAGADCLFAPGTRDPETIREIVEAVAPKPVNVLMSAPNEELSVATLADIGVRRISVGSALARTAWGAFTHAAESILHSGSFETLRGAETFTRLNSVFQQHDT